jgi:hypothetical protein
VAVALVVTNMLGVYHVCGLEASGFQGTEQLWAGCPPSSVYLHNTLTSISSFQNVCFYSQNIYFFHIGQGEGRGESMKSQACREFMPGLTYRKKKKTHFPKQGKKLIHPEAIGSHSFSIIFIICAIKINKSSL